MNNSKLISVIIPCYNVAPFVERCLNSVINNTYKNLEIICIDDCSPDNGLEIINEIAKQDDRIIVIKQEKNGGVSSARNAGLKIATGEFITFIDPDDWVHPQYFEILMTVLEETLVQAVICNFKTSIETIEFSEIDCKSINVNISNLYDCMNNVHVRTKVWARIYRKELIDGLRFSEELNYLEDTVYNMCALSSNENNLIATVDKELYYYFMNESSITHTVVPKEQSMTAAKLCIKTVENENSHIKLMIFYEQAFRFLFACRYLNTFSVDYKKLKKEVLFVAKDILKRYNSLQTVKINKKFVYYIILYFPCVYRLFRIATDKTLIQWEKNERKKKK